LPDLDDVVVHKMFIGQCTVLTLYMICYTVSVLRLVKIYPFCLKYACLLTIVSSIGSYNHNRIIR